MVPPGSRVTTTEQAVGAQRGGELFDLRALATAVESFEGNELAAMGHRVIIEHSQLGRPPGEGRAAASSECVSTRTADIVTEFSNFRFSISIEDSLIMHCFAEDLVSTVYTLVAAGAVMAQGTAPTVKISVDAARCPPDGSRPTGDSR